jgi:hypothetical protein
VPERAGSERIALIDVLIAEHRDRAKALRDQRAAIQTTIAAVGSGLVALGAILLPRLPYRKFNFVDDSLLALIAVAVVVLLTAWVDALGGPDRRRLLPYHEAVNEAAAAYNDMRPSLDPIEVRTALLNRLTAEEALAERELLPRLTSLRIAIVSAFVALNLLSILGLHLVGFFG